MCTRIRCVYCNKIIKIASSEHVIQNALGGLLESTKICCQNCNNLISRIIDKPFVSAFNPIIGNIINLRKTNKRKSRPSYTGKAFYDNKLYTVILKDKKIIACPELANFKKQKLTDEDLKSLEDGLLYLDFNLENNSFKNGIRKIAFNFAIEKNIPKKLLKNHLKIIDDNIEFSFPIIPFIPMNYFDEYIENESEFKMYHSLILFNQENKLWCYVDLFNTFQYYILLSNKWSKSSNILETHCQYIEQLERTTPKLYIRRPKDILYYSQQYDVKPNFNIEEFKKQIYTAIQKKSLTKDLGKLIHEKSYNYFSILNLEDENVDKDLILYKLQDFNLYIDENDNFNKKNFRQKTYLNGNLVSYPDIINAVLENDVDDCKIYTSGKFQRLTNHLLNK